MEASIDMIRPGRGHHAPTTGGGVCSSGANPWGDPDGDHVSLASSNEYMNMSRH